VSEDTKNNSVVNISEKDYKWIVYGRMARIQDSNEILEYSKPSKRQEALSFVDWFIDRVTLESFITMNGIERNQEIRVRFYEYLGREFDPKPGEIWRGTRSSQTIFVVTGPSERPGRIKGIILERYNPSYPKEQEMYLWSLNRQYVRTDHLADDFKRRALQGLEELRLLTTDALTAFSAAEKAISELHKIQEESVLSEKAFLPKHVISNTSINVDNVWTPMVQHGPVPSKPRLVTFTSDNEVTYRSIDNVTESDGSVQLENPRKCSMNAFRQWIDKFSAKTKEVKIREAESGRYFITVMRNEDK